MLKVKELNKKFRGFEALKNININAESGQIYGLVGSNGCGKTTLLKHIINIYSPDDGEVYFNDKLMNENSEEMKEFYYVQDDLFFPYGYTLNKMFDYEKLLYKNMSVQKYNKLVDFFGINTNTRLNKMSKGQRKQAAFILAMAAQPRVLLLDEIVDGLDAVVRRKFWNVLIGEILESKMTVIISSHALKELDNICDKIGIMHEGKIIKEERMDTLKEDIKRVQFAIDDEYKKITSEKFDVVKTSKIGSVYFSVLKGDIKEFRKSLDENYNVLIFDELPMNLEEIFITELGGVGYGIQEYIS